jgi:hypothetical protein
MRTGLLFIAFVMSVMASGALASRYSRTRAVGAAVMMIISMLVALFLGNTSRHGSASSPSSSICAGLEMIAISFWCRTSHSI